MSSRVLRKLQGDQELLQPDDNSDIDETDVPISSAGGNGGARRKQLNINRYDLLNQQSHSESEVKEDDDNETENTAPKPTEDGRDESVKRKKKKKKKKVESKSTAAVNSRRNRNETKRSLRDDNKTPEDDVPVVCKTPTEIGGNKNILSVQHRNLNPNNELKRIFGSKIFPNKRRVTRGAGSRSNLKQTWLVQAKDNWPHIGKSGLSMKLVEKTLFAYEHNLNYQSVQTKFLEAVETLNPRNIVMIIESDHPYNVDALIQLSDLCKMSDDLAMAAELIERALYCLECGFHPLFNVVQGNCQLDYRRQENRALFIVLFKHLIFVGGRACYRTALEFCKVLLSLSPMDDPLAVVLTIDFYALRSKQYSWLIDFFDEWEQRKNLSQLPNFAFSIAIAHYYLASRNNPEELERANELLQDALIMFPGVLMPLLEKCSVQSDSRVTSHSYFTNTDSSKGLQQLINLYICRGHHIWKEPDLLPWLEKNVHAVLDRIDSGKENSLIKKYAEYRAVRYNGTPRNISRHILLSDFKEITAQLNTDSTEPVMTFDPLPPPDSINLYSRPRGPRRGTNYNNSSAVSIFFQSLLPNFIVEPAQAAGVANGDDERVEGALDGEGASGVDLRRSFTSLLDAMRDLLSNVRLPDVPNDADIDENDDSDTDNEENYI